MIRNSIYLLFLSCSLLACKTEEEFNLSLAPGSYTGLIDYYPVDSQGRPDPARAKLSKFDEFTVAISEDEGNYILAFDNSQRYEIPEITVTMLPQHEENTEDMAYFEMINGQEYSGADMYNADRPDGLFFKNETDRYVGCNLTLKSNDPDSVYFLQIAVRRNF